MITRREVEAIPHDYPILLGVDKARILELFDRIEQLEAEAEENARELGEYEYEALERTKASNAETKET